MAFPVEVRTVHRHSLLIVTAWSLILRLAVSFSLAQLAAALSRTQVLVDTDWVAANLANPGVRILDLSSTREVYDRGHLSGAVFVDWKVDLVDPTHRVAGMAPTREQFQSLARRLGIWNTETVIFYDDNNSLFAAPTGASCYSQ